MAISSSAFLGGSWGNPNRIAQLMLNSTAVLAFKRATPTLQFLMLINVEE